MCGVLIALTGIAFAATGEPPGESRPLDACVPADTLAVYFARPSPDLLNAPPGGVVDRLAGWLIALKSLGIIPKQGRVLADIVGTLPMLGRRPHALALLDITSTEVKPGSYRLHDLQSALLIDAKGMELEIDRRVRDLLRTYTDAQSGRVESMTAAGVEYHRLVDQRLPPWAVIEWGTIGSHFIATIGDGAFGRMLDTFRQRERSLADDPWFAGAHHQCSGATSGIEVFADILRIRRRIGEAVKTRPEQVLRALHLERAERLLWAVGFDGRQLRSEAVAREMGGFDLHIRLTGKGVAAEGVTASIPDEAHRYAAFRIPLAEVFRNARLAYLQGRSPEARQRLKDGWARLEHEFEFDVETGLLDHLGEHLVFHTYPPHPLGLPMLCTIWIQKDGNRPIVSRTIDRMMAAWQRYMNEPDFNQPDQEGDLVETRPSVSLSPRIKRDADGVWYLQLGFLGPALAVADEWIVISFSPYAVQRNLKHLAKPASLPAPAGQVIGGK